MSLTGRWSALFLPERVVVKLAARPARKKFLDSKTYKIYNRGMVNAAMIPLREAAERLGVHENTVRNWIDRGVIVGVRLPTGTRRLPVAEVERLEREMFAMPTSFASEVVVPAPKPVPGEDPPGAYPDL